MTVDQSQSPHDPGLVPPRPWLTRVGVRLAVGGALLAAGIVAFAAWRWSRTPEPAEVPVASNGRAGLAPELERRVDEELARFDG